MKKAAVLAAALAVFLSAPDSSAMYGERYLSKETQNTLIELYTSNAKAECDPALAWMTTLKSDPELWKTHFPMAMHVSFWDGPYGRDIYALKEADERFLLYKKHWNTRYAFVPAVALNGVEWGGWSHGKQIPPAPQRITGILDVDGTLRQNLFVIRYTPPKDMITGKFSAHVAIVGMGLQSKPPEGQGRAVLKQDFVVLYYKQQKLPGLQKVLAAEMEIPARKRLMPCGQYRALIWISEQGDPLPVQVVGGVLPL